MQALFLKGLCISATLFFRSFSGLRSRGKLPASHQSGLSWWCSPSEAVDTGDETVSSYGW